MLTLFLSLGDCWTAAADAGLRQQARQVEADLQVKKKRMS